MTNPSPMHLSQMISDWISGEIDSDRQAQLHQILEEDPEALRYYIEYITTWALLDECGGKLAPKVVSREFFTDFLKALASDEKIAPTIKIAKPKIAPQEHQSAEPIVPVRKISRLPIITVLMSSAALLLAFVYVYLNPRQIEVATLVDSIGAQWSDAQGSMQVGCRFLTQKKSIVLKQGIIKVLYDNDVEVLIEAPAEYQILSSEEIALQSGRLFARVSPTGRGFAVKTQNTRIVDFGTEFGVYCDLQDKTELHVFKGKTVLTSTKNKKEESLGVINGRAITVNAEGDIKEIQLNKDTFVRGIDSKTNMVWRKNSLDLADIVGSGNGFGTGQLNRWLDVMTGQPGQWMNSNASPVSLLVSTDYRYHPVTYLQGVDGVFIPDGEKGPFQVSSAGDVWAECPDTSGGCFENIYNGHEIKEGVLHTLTAHGQAYGTREHSGLALHSNVGITFDLKKIRDRLSGIVITGFRTGCAISSDAQINSRVDFWVLVDGKARTSVKGLSRDNGLRDIAVKLKSTDRFLTLVCTDSDKDSNGDWGFFAAPQLDIESE